MTSSAAKKDFLATAMAFISPTGQFLLGLLLYGEPFTASQAVAFGCIWAALVAGGG